MRSTSRSHVVCVADGADVFFTFGHGRREQAADADGHYVSDGPMTQPGAAVRDAEPVPTVPRRHRVRVE